MNWIKISEVPPPEVTPLFVFGWEAEGEWYADVAELEDGWWNDPDGFPLTFIPEYYAHIEMPIK